MTSCALNWTIKQVVNRKAFGDHRQCLRHAWKFYFALLAKLVPGLWPFDVHLGLRDGGEIIVSQFMTLYIYKEVFCDKCYDIEVFGMPERPTIIDVGSNTGLFILRMKQLYPNAKLYGYEPQETNFALLCATLKLNNPSDTHVFKLGVGAHDRKEKLFVHKRNIGGSSIIKSQVDADDYEEVELIGLASLLETNDLESCDLLKLDCEGAEHEIILSITPAICQRVSRIIFESTPKLYDVGELVSHLERIGYLVHERKNGLYDATRR